MNPSIKKLIAKRLTGKDWVQRDKLRRYLNLSNFDHPFEYVTDRQMRRAIVEMRKKDGLLVLSSSKGYKMCATVQEFNRHLKYKESFAYSILKECKLMKKNFKRHTKPQLFSL